MTMSRPWLSVRMALGDKRPEDEPETSSRTHELGHALTVCESESMDQRAPRRLSRRRCLEKSVVGESIRDDALPGLENRRVLAHLLEDPDARRRDLKVPAE
jgi:PleD family two-component response regulator